ncbi:nucleoside kinase [Hathewaya limosa]|uniref:Uridine kinase n=1 Tax=Hathewaya limosa TaxID=1536 RepID=A0ABU0JS61_HATLI|nr:nucleoside kinase [Hathewaya limosa]MDQ0479943.1 uridine kinase [Hathewaya limosa]
MSDKLKLFLRDLNKNVIVEKGIQLYDIVKEFNINKENPIILAKVNDDVYELTEKLKTEGNFEVITNKSDLGRRSYIRTLQFVLVKAAYDVLEECEVDIQHSLSRGLYCEIHKDNILTLQELKAIKNRMREIIDANEPIYKEELSREKAMEIFRSYNMIDKVMLLESLSVSKVKLYKLQDRYDYFYGSMAYSTGVVKSFELVPYNSGFILRYPTLDSPNEIPKFVEHNKLAKIFNETEAWGDILEVPHVGALNKIIDDKHIKKLILINEGLHEKKIAYIADMISQKKTAKLVLIAGPSSSGKTTFTKRLSVQLAVNGLRPVQISMDDFFVDRELTPKDEDGNYDFESINALDIKLFNRTMKAILNGEEVKIPTFNFKTGKKEWRGDKVKLPKNGIILIEGIHGLNEKLTSSISKDEKFKIYINCLTQLNIDNHNRIPTTDVRMVRRIVRDSLTRGYDAEDTLVRWPSVKRGEKKNIFVFEDESDIMFNSNLVYEICVLKKYALAELEKVEKNSPVYYEAWRLKSFLHFFREIDMELVPENSLLREFIGGSCFYDY